MPEWQASQSSHVRLGFNENLLRAQMINNNPIVQEGWGLLKKAHLIRQGTALGTETRNSSVQKMEHTKPRTDNRGGVQKRSLVT